MKKIAKPVLFGVIFIACLFVISTSCKKTAAAAVCNGNLALCGTHVFDACCTETDCYYMVDNSVKFPCNGLDCTAAANQLVTQYCLGGLSFTEQQALATVEKVLAAIK
ncbi:MAG: hypothetical protein NTZ12_09410 [Candidatus Aminicenantes bacterium]|nr:hypothetical protein [Candidatus Aminicenantes bacterium]